MSTVEPHEKYRKEGKAEPTVQLISRFARMRVTLEHNRDEYTPMGGLRTTVRGRQLKFNHGRFACPESWMPDVLEHPDFGQSFWVAGDPTGTQAQTGPQVVEGALAAGYNTRAAQSPPVPEWDELGARQLRPLIQSGRVDLDAALLWEFNHRNRQQVLDALRKAKDTVPEAEEGTEAPSDDDAGFVQQTPED